MNINALVTKVLTLIYLVYFVYVYKFFSDTFHIPMILTEQWFQLSSIIMLGIVIFCVFTVMMCIYLHCEDEYLVAEIYQDIYRSLSDKVISSLWYIMLIPFMIMFFQYGEYIITFATFTIILAMYAFRTVHLRVVQKEKMRN